MEAFSTCTNYCSYRKKWEYSHEKDFQKRKTFGVCKFQLKAKGKCKNSDECQWSHQIAKPLYKDKTVTASDALPSYTKY